MRRIFATGALIGALTVTGGALLVPGLASAEPERSAASGSAGSGWFDRVLDGLVGDGTLTQDQADEVTTALEDAVPQHHWGGFGDDSMTGGFDHGMGGFAGGFSAPDLAGVAEAAGASVDELRAAMEGGTSLADLARSNGVSKEALVDRLVADAKAMLAEDVEAGRLTQAQADDWVEGLDEAVADMVEHGGTAGDAWHGHFGGGPVEDEATPSQPSSFTQGA